MHLWADDDLEGGFAGVDQTGGVSLDFGFIYQGRVFYFQTEPGDAVGQLCNVFFSAQGFQEDFGGFGVLVFGNGLLLEWDFFPAGGF